MRSPYVANKPAPYRLNASHAPFVGESEGFPTTGIPLIVVGGFQKTYASFDGVTFQRIGDCGTGNVEVIKYHPAIGKFFAVNTDQNIYQLEYNLTWTLVYSSTVGAIRTFSTFSTSVNGSGFPPSTAFATPGSTTAILRSNSGGFTTYTTGFSPNGPTAYGGTLGRFIGCSNANQVSTRTNGAASVISPLPTVPTRPLNMAYCSLNGRAMVSDSNTLWWSAANTPTVAGDWNVVTLPARDPGSSNLWNVAELMNVLIIADRDVGDSVALSVDNGSTFSLSPTGIASVTWMNAVPAMGYIYLCGTGGKICRTANGVVFEDLGVFDQSFGVYGAIASIQNR